MFFGFLELFILIKEEDCESPASVFLWTQSGGLHGQLSQWVCMDNSANCFASHLILFQVSISLLWEVSSFAAQLFLSSSNPCPLSCAQKWLWFIKPSPYLKTFIRRHGCNRETALLWILHSDKIYGTRVSTDCVTLAGQDKGPTLCL